MEPTNLSYMPEGYPLCLIEDCPRKQTCLHWLAYANLAPKEMVVAYNPRLIDTEGGTSNCRHYADSAPVRYVRGFTDIFDSLTKKQAELLNNNLRTHFGFYNYYRYRRGEFLFPPTGQAYMQNLAERLGINTPIAFSNYVELPYWGDHIIKA